MDRAAPADLHDKYVPTTVTCACARCPPAEHAHCARLLTNHWQVNTRLLLLRPAHITLHSALIMFLHNIVQVDDSRGAMAPTARQWPPLRSRRPLEWRDRLPCQGESIAVACGTCSHLGESPVRLHRSPKQGACQTQHGDRVLPTTEHIQNSEQLLGLNSPPLNDTPTLLTVVVATHHASEED